MAFCKPSASRSHKPASTFTPLGFSFSHIGGDAGPHVKHCQEIQRRYKSGISPYTASTPVSTFNLVLWHEDVYPTNPSDLTDYLNDILTFALYLQQTQNIPTRLMLTLSNDGDLNTETLLTAIENTMRTALSEGLTIGFQLGAYANLTTTTPPPTLAALKTVVSSLARTYPSLKYIVSCDSEGFIYEVGYTPKANASGLSLFAVSIMADIGSVGVSPLPSNVAVIGGAAGNPTWSPPLINVYEVYSQYTWNSIITSETNNATALWSSLTHKNNGKFPNTIGNASGSVPGWYAFSVECKTGCDCLSSQYFPPSKSNICGGVDVFGKNTANGGGWTLDFFLSFLKNAASTIKGTPTFVLYQSALLPMSWLNKAKDPLNFLFG